MLEEMGAVRAGAPAGPHRCVQTPKKLEVCECDTTTTHGVRCDCMLHKPRSLSLHAQPEWNPVKLQGFIDSHRHIGRKRQNMDEAAF